MDRPEFDLLVARALDFRCRLLAMALSDPTSKSRDAGSSNAQIRGDSNATSLRSRESRDLDEDHLDLVWSGLFNARVFADYFAKLSNRYARFVSRARSINGLLCLASASTLACQHDLTAVLAPLLAAFAGAVTMWDILWRISEKAREASVLQLAWDRLAIRYRSLWTSVHDPNSERVVLDLEDRRAELEQRHTSLDHSMRWYNKHMQASMEGVRRRHSFRRPANSKE